MSSRTFATDPSADMNAWLGKIVAFTGGDIDEIVQTAGEAVNSEAQVDAPVRSGDLKDSHNVGEVKDGEVEIGAYIHYALPVHANHPTKAGWYRDAIIRSWRPALGRLLREALRRRGAR